MKRNIIYLGLPLSIVALAIVKAGTPNNPHRSLKRDCEECHTTESFTEIRFDHENVGFALEGNHDVSDCTTCHTIEDFSKTETSCLNCHQDVHEAKLGSDCLACHSLKSWTKFDFDEIHLNTEFPMMGQHTTIDCESCHKNIPRGDMSFGVTRCVECHQQDFLEASTPQHVANGFSTECLECHQMNRWESATLSDHDAIFPIFSGAHNGKWDDCSSCHTVPGNSSAFNCVSCHEHSQQLMDNTHQNAVPGYSYASESCYSCHPDGRKASLSVDHTSFFPINSGVHAGQWDGCATCHGTAAAGAPFTCFTCHSHNQASMDNVHQGRVPGYSYSSSSCYQCHPDGKKSGAAIDHDPIFPIFSGPHRRKWDDCTTCHDVAGEATTFTCFNCHVHRQSSMDRRHKNKRGYSYDSQACYGCHPRGRE